MNPSPSNLWSLRRIAVTAWLLLAPLLVLGLVASYARVVGRT